MSLDTTEDKIDVREGLVHSAIPADELARLSDDGHFCAEDGL